MQEFCGTLSSSPSQDESSPHCTAAMLNHMLRGTTQPSKIISAANASIGAMAYRGEPTIASTNDTTIAVAGEVYDGEDHTNLAQRLLQQYSERGIESLQQLQGIHAIAVWNATKRRLHLLTDRCGFRKLYHAHIADQLFWSTRYTAFGAAPAFPRDLDPEAIHEFCRFGYFLGEKTFYAHAKAIAPGTMLTWSDGNVESTSYWDYSFPIEIHNPREAADALAEVTRAAVARQSGGYHCLQLTGGLDSRVIAGFLNEINPDARAQATTIGEHHALEVAYGKHLAKDLGYLYRPTYIDEAFHTQYAEEAVWRTEGTLLNHTGWRLAIDEWAAQQEFDCVSNGFFGNAVRSGGLLYTDDDSLTDSDLIPYALAMLRDMRSEMDLDRLFRDPQLSTSAEDHISNLLDQAPTDRVANKLDFVDYHTRQRGYLATNLAYARPRGRTFAPLTDNTVVDMGTRMGPDARRNSCAYQRMILDHLPQACRAPYTRSRLPLSAPRYEMLARKAYGRIYYKVLPQLLGGRVGTKNRMVYVPYRGAITGASRAIFEDNMPHIEAFADIINVDEARKVMAEYSAGQHPGYGPAYAINTLCLWQKQFGAT